MFILWHPLKCILLRLIMYVWHCFHWLLCHPLITCLLLSLAVRMSSNVPLCLMLISPPSSCWLIINTDLSLHCDLWDPHQDSMWNRNNMFWVGWRDQKAPRWYSISFISPCPDCSRCNRQCINHITLPTHQYKCKSHNLVLLCRLWLCNRLSAKWCWERSPAH